MGEYDLSPQARIDFNEIIDYIARDNVPASNRMEDRFLHALGLLADMPGMGHSRRDIRDQSLKTWTVKSYVIVYRIVPTGIHVVRIVHGARDFWSIFGSGD